ncbi:MAG: integrin [Herpetosiphonaceae bacterium]|nr:integrin [Herpetosiphonaceae bacterium]
MASHLPIRWLTLVVLIVTLASLGVSTQSQVATVEAGLNTRDWQALRELLPPSAGQLPVQSAYLKASNTQSEDLFGYAVAIDGDTVVVGVNQEDSAAIGVDGNQQDNSADGAGAVYVFVRSNAQGAPAWSQQAYLKASNTDAGDNFGYAVAVDGDTIVVGAWREASAATGVNGNQQDNTAFGSGAAYVFVRSNAQGAPAWSQQAYLKASNTDADVGDQFGAAVAIDGDTIVVGAYGEESGASGVNGNQQENTAPMAGAAYVFVRTNTAWIQQAYLKASNPEANDIFGLAVTVDSDTIVVGAYIEDSAATGVDGNQQDNSSSGSGAAYVFVRTGTVWSQQAYLKASNTNSFDLFGCSVAIDGDTIVVGAWHENSGATGVNGDQQDTSVASSGAAYVFVRTGTVWSQQAYLKASNSGYGDLFGSVNLDGNTIVVGSIREDSAATGVNGNQADNSSSNAGASYVFTRTGTVWSQLAYIKASNSDSDDQFGAAVAVEGSTIVIGATTEASSAIGVDGNQQDNTAFNAGAAYILTIPPAIQTTTAYLPMVMSSGMPDLIGSIALSPDTSVFAAGAAVQVTVTITNTGDAPSPAAWADLYINPNTPPTAPNTPWNQTCTLSPCTGIAWVIPALAPGDHVTLTSTVGSYADDYTIWPGFFIAGTTDLYLYVDSYNEGNASGAVVERDEQNNRAEIHGLTVIGRIPAWSPDLLPADIPIRPAASMER